MLTHLATMGALQVHQATKDRMLTLLPLMLFFNGLFCKVGLLDLQQYALNQHQTDLGPHLFAIATIFFMVPVTSVPAFVGGLLLIEAREERVDHALRLTPMPPWVPHVTLYTIVAGLCLSSLFFLCALLPVPVPWGPCAIGILLMTGTAVCTTGTLALLAHDRSAYMGIGKMITFITMLPALAYVLPSQWDVLLAILPSYWGYQVLWLGQTGDPTWTGYILPGILYHLAWFIGIHIWIVRRR